MKNFRDIDMDRNLDRLVGAVDKAADKTVEAVEDFQESLWKGLARAGKEIRREVTQTARNFKKFREDYQAAPNGQPPAPEKIRKETIPDPLQEQENLTKEMDRAIHRAYYKEGGFRFFGGLLLQYVKAVMPSQTELVHVWAGGYNSCIQPMLRQVDKLEGELEVIQNASDREPLERKNQGLLEKMRLFRFRAQTERLNSQENWELAEYKEALRKYAGDLDAQLLTVYQPPGQEVFREKERENDRGQ